MLKAVVVITALAPLSTLMTTPSAIPMVTRLVAAALWVLTLSPAMAYLRTPPASRRPIPFLPVIGLLFGLYTALPVVTGAENLHWSIHVEPATDYRVPVILSLAGWTSLLAGRALAASYGVTRPRHSWRFEPAMLHTLGMMLAFLGIAFDFGRRLVTLPESIRSLAQFSLTMSWFGMGLLIALAASRQLRFSGRVALVTAIAVNLVLQATSGLVSNVAILLMVLYLLYWVANHRLPRKMLIVGVAMLLPLVAMRALMGEYRRIAWYGGGSVTPLSGVTLLYSLASDKLQREGAVALLSGGGEAVAARSATIDVLADVVRRTPSEVPYWGGDTFKSLIGIAIPRFLWPDKPQKNLGQQFGHRYSYLDRNDLGTSFNLPQIVEFYANFGTWGVLIGMFVVGIIFATVERYVNQPGQEVIRSIAGICLLIPLFNIESDFSLVFGGLFLNAIGLRFLIRLADQHTTRLHRAPPLPDRARGEETHGHRLGPA